MSKHIQPVTIFCRDDNEALQLSSQDTDSFALTQGIGTLRFHSLIAKHGAGEFTTLYVPERLRGSFKAPVGGIVREAVVGCCPGCRITVLYSSDAKSAHCSSCQRSQDFGLNQLLRGEIR